MALEHINLVEYIQYLQRNYCGSLPIKKAVLLTGKQANGTWIFNSDTFLTASGEILIPDETDYVVLNKDIVYEGDKIRAADISPNIVLPLNDKVITELIDIWTSYRKT